MHRSLKIPLLIVGGLIAAVLLVTGGFLLGARDDLGSALRGLFPVVSGSQSDGSAELQQEVLDKLDSTYYKAVDDTKLHTAAIDGMVASLDDPYTVYWDPEEYAAFKQSTSGSYTGLGMSVEMDEGLVTIVSTFKQSPADLAGIKAGDIIVSVDGRPVDGRTLQQVVDELKGGAEGSSVTVGIYRPPASALTTTTTAGTASSGSTTASSESTTTTTDPLAKADTSKLPPGGVKTDYTLTRKNISIPVTEKKVLQAGDKKVALIGFFTFSQGSAAALRSAVKQATEIDEVNAVILDLRSNGGGLLDQAVDVASIFLPQGDVVVSTQGLHSPKQVYKAVGGDYPDIPLYVLTDPYTASASEIVSGALQDYGRAVLVGETTFGKGLVQSIEPLSNGGALKATTAIYLTPQGRDINKKGISPEITAPDDPATSGVDETVEATLKLITGEATVPATTSTTSTTAATLTPPALSPSTTSTTAATN
jgi:carboxyl-terminal processing protease